MISVHQPLEMLAGIVTPITPADIPLYRQFFNQDNRATCYGNSWTYITQACRGLGLGFKYYDHDVLLSIGLHQDHHVIVRPLGCIDQRLIEILSKLREISGKAVFIKKLFPDQVAVLRNLAVFKPAAYYDALQEQAFPGAYVWDKEAWADDDTYPELIFDLEVALNYQAQRREWFNQFQKARLTPAEAPRLKKIRSGYVEFRRRVKRFSQTGIRCWLRKYEPSLAADVRRFLGSYFGSDNPGKVAAYENMLLIPHLEPGNDRYFAWVGYVDGVPEPVSFSFAERLDRDSAGYYAGIASRWQRDWPEYLQLQVMAQLRQAGFKYLNFGGSEVKSLHHYKCKPAPVEERSMTMLVYGAD